MKRQIDEQLTALDELRLVKSAYVTSSPIARSISLSVFAGVGLCLGMLLAVLMAVVEQVVSRF